MGSWPHDTVVDAVVPTVEDAPFPATVVKLAVEDTPFPATVIDRLLLAGVARRDRPRHRHRGLVGQLKVLGIAAGVLALACVYAFGVLGRDTSVGAAEPSAMTDKRQDAAPTGFEVPLETIPLGEPWFSAPEGLPKTPPQGRSRRK
jgi:hypothetical protein